MNRFKLVPAGGPTVNQDRVSRVLPFIRGVAHEWSADKLRGYIETGEVPASYVQTVIEHVKADPTLIIVTKPDFLAAIAHEYPELHGILTSPEGDAWLEKCLAEIGKGVVTSAFSFLRGG
ncbi:MAG: hypothetical protein C4534_08310 [Gaiellales bacterium]|nr:MAG: hypothetical protein C4534_08310 [Gaiellales bacterium]